MSQILKNNIDYSQKKQNNGGKRMVFGKKKLDEKKLMVWVNKSLDGGSDMEQISKVLNRKYPKKEVADFLKKNYSVEPEVKDKKLDKGLEEENRKKEEEDELDTEMEALKAEAIGKEPEEMVTPEDVPEAPLKGIEKKPEEVSIDDMSTYKIELLNQVASINQGIMKLVEIYKKKK